MTRKRWIWIVAVLLVFGFFYTDGYGIVHWYGTGNTPEDALYFGADNNLPVWRVKQVLATVDVERNSKILFYENQQGGLMIANVTRKWNGNWKMTGSGGEEHAGEQVPIGISGIRFDDAWVDYGYINSADVVKVQVAGETAAILTTPDQKRIYYKVSPVDKAHVSMQTIAFDKNGHIVHHN